MPIELPASEKVYTTVYDNFKGVDYTNDPTNVWRHRSPSGVNMLPDASGRPFKRYGWERVISNSEMLTILNEALSNVEENPPVVITAEASTGDTVTIEDKKALLTAFNNQDGEYEFIWSAKYGVVTEDDVEASEDGFGDAFNWDEGDYIFTLEDGVWSYVYIPEGEEEPEDEPEEIDLSTCGVALLRDFEDGESFTVTITVDFDASTWEYNKQPTDLETYGLFTAGEFGEDDTLSVTISGCKSEIEVTKCCWFELCGLPHIAVFTDKMAFFCYIENEGGVIADVSLDEDLYNSYDRAFFFEGDGKSAFYIYGSNKVWEYLDDLKIHSAKPYVPNVISGADATSVGTMIQGFNLLGSHAWIGYNSNSCKTSWTSEGLVAAVDYDTYTTVGITICEYEDGWSYKVGGETTEGLPDGVTVLPTPKNGDIIKIVIGNYIVLPNNVSQMQYSEIEVYGSTGSQFDTKYEVITGGELASRKCLYIQDEELNAHAVLQFNETLTEIVEGEDFIKVVYPSRSVIYTTYEEETAITKTGQATLVIGGGE